jgi:heptosyltransferase II
MKRAIVIQTSFLGDVVLSLCIPQKLKRFYPECVVEVVVRKGSEGLLAHHPAIDKVWTWDKQKNKQKNLLSLIRALRAERYDLAINLQRYASTGLMMASIQADKKVGFDASWLDNPFGFALDHRYPAVKDGPVNTDHEVDRYMRMIAPYTDDTREIPRIFPRPEDYQAVARYTEGTPYLVIAPFSVWLTKEFPVQQWIKVIKKLSYDYRVFMVGSAAESRVCNELAIFHPHAENLAGQLSFLELAALMSRSAQVFCNDSMPQHLAGAVNAPTTVLYLSTVPEYGFYCLSDKVRIAQVNQALDCRPCGLHGHKQCPKGHFKCAMEISIDDVVGEFKQQALEY